MEEKESLNSTFIVEVKCMENDYLGREKPRPIFSKCFGTSKAHG